MRQKRIFLLSTMMILLLFIGGKGQETKSYRTLSGDLSQLKEQFNKDQGKTRLLLLLAPS
ncbi:MAG: hypothetical protein AB1489_11225 [Acidobacteriota bacterium]